MTTRYEDPGPEGPPARPHEAFANALWSLVVDEDGRTGGQPSWIEAWLRNRPSEGAPEHPVPAALHRILACGVDPDDLTDVVRAMQHDLLYNVCQLIDDPGLLGLGAEDDQPGGTDYDWELVAVRTAGPADRTPLHGLHAVLDEHDPSGRAGEPRGRPVPARLPGHPLHARLAAAHALAGDRVEAIRTWRNATGAPLSEAQATIDRLVEQLRQDPDGTAQ
ncbi:hypothetical protein [Kitasatospora sp. NPDC092286]|uniref:hypothetical protein n=1 Tax=Kitasatospora sp. NPDC092286 TaxID=3364087 RepID=UPI0038067849